MVLNVSIVGIVPYWRRRGKGNELFGYAPEKQVRYLPDIHLAQKYAVVRVRCERTPEKNSESFFGGEFLLFGLDYWQKNAKISSRLEKI